MTNQIKRLRPVGQRILVKPLVDDRTAGGLYIRPDFIERNESCGIVLAIGERARCKCADPECDALLPHVKVGDMVLYPRLSETSKVLWHGHELALVPSKDVQLIMDKPVELPVKQ